MLIAIYTKGDDYGADKRYTAMLERLSDAGFEYYYIRNAEDIRPGTLMVLSVGGDGTFLSASKRVGVSGIPVGGVNLGRLGFLSEYSPEEVADALVRGTFCTEDRDLLEVKLNGPVIEEGSSFWPYALNEISIHRSGAAILGEDVLIDGDPLPTYWADGLLVATSSGSTAYSLSVGGPICTPDTKVLIISPIAPHNLNVRPLVVPCSTEISLSVRSRDENVIVSMDNRTLKASPQTRIDVRMAQFSLKRVRLEKSNFIKALKTKLFWGEDIRNGEN